VQAAKGEIMFPLLVLALVLMQGSITVNSYTLVWWESK
jgi:hypothetical protein